MSVKHEHLLLENQLNMLNGSMVYFSGSYPPHTHLKSLFRTPSDRDLQNACTGLRVEERCPPHGRKPNVEGLKNGKIGFKKGGAKKKPDKSLWPFFWDGEVKRPFQKAFCDLPGSPGIPGCFHLENVQPFNLQPAGKRGWEKKPTAFISALVFEGLHSLKVT